MFINTWNQKKHSMCRFGFAVIAAAVMLAGFHQSAFAIDVKQKSFKSPEEAASALVGATKVNDTKELLMILGPAGKDLIFSGDAVADKAGRDRFVKAYEEMNKLVSENDKKVILHVGNEEWPYPIPVVKKGENWRFDTMAGIEEILNRRIGRNELNAIQVCLAYVDAQREYILKEQDKDKLLEYAQKFVSDKGQNNGLYWEAKEDEEQSPLGPLMAKAAREGYSGKVPVGKRNPYHGYYYKILKSQGKNARGGKYNYVVNGKMIGGFALVAYPAEYGDSGVMTFIVNQDGVVYERNLGKKNREHCSSNDEIRSEQNLEESGIILSESIVCNMTNFQTRMEKVFPILFIHHLFRFNFSLLISIRNVL
jgi:23S rRNA maturation mini-RNase III